MDELVYYGEDGLNFIKEYGGTEFIYNSLIECEKQIIKELANWFVILEQIGRYDNPPTITSEFPAEKATAHHIAVVCDSGVGFINESMNQNGRTFFWEPTEGDYREFLLRGGTYPTTCKLSLLSSNRPSVSRLADQVYQGLMSDIRIALKKKGITISANTIKSLGPPKRVEMTKDRGYFQIDIMISELIVPWQQALTIEGEIIKDFSFDLKKDEL